MSCIFHTWKNTKIITDIHSSNLLLRCVLDYTHLFAKIIYILTPNPLIQGRPPQSYLRGGLLGYSPQ